MMMVWLFVFGYELHMNSIFVWRVVEIEGKPEEVEVEERYKGR